MTEERIVVVDEPNAQVVQYSTSEDGRRAGVATDSETNRVKFYFSEGQAVLLARLKSEHLKRA